MLKLLALLPLLVLGSGAHAATLYLSCGPANVGRAACYQMAEEWARYYNHDLRRFELSEGELASLDFWRQRLGAQPQPSDEPLPLDERGELRPLPLTVLRQRLAAPSLPDIFLIDAAWVGALGEFLADNKADWQGTARDFPAPLVENNHWRGRWLALPWTLEVPLLYYRKDLLQRYNLRVPTNWADLERYAAITVQAEREELKKRRITSPLRGLVFAAQSNEDLSLLAQEMIQSFGGAPLADVLGGVHLNTAHTAFALQALQQWTGNGGKVEGIVPMEALRFDYAQALTTFKRGEAVFYRGWAADWDSFAQSDSNVRDRFGAIPMPAGASLKRIGFLGGWQMVVRGTSRNREAAASLIRYLTSLPSQRRRAQILRVPPISAELYADPSIQRNFAHARIVKEALAFAAVPPTTRMGGKTLAANALLADIVRRLFTARIKPEDAAKQLEDELIRIRQLDW